MIQTILSASTYQANILAALQQTGIANTTPGGKARAFCDILGDQLGLLDANKANDIAQSLLPYALGSNLDFLGQIYGVTRLPAVDASSSAADNNFQFYVLGGNINQGSLHGRKQTRPRASGPGPAALGLRGPAHGRLSSGNRAGQGTFNPRASSSGENPIRRPHAPRPLPPPAQAGTQAEMSDEAWCRGSPVLGFEPPAALYRGELKRKAAMTVGRGG